MFDRNIIRECNISGVDHNWSSRGVISLKSTISGNVDVEWRRDNYRLAFFKGFADKKFSRDEDHKPLN